MKQQKGFTLVELSIVLVIIGLIVGGIIGGQSLISSAKLQSIIKDINKYKTAVRAFELQYDALPGDFAEAEEYWGRVSGSCSTSAGTGTQTCNGDGDGLIDYEYSFGNSWNNTPHEPWRVWEHLQNAEIISGNLSGVYVNLGGTATQTGEVPGGNVPEGPISGSVFAIFHAKASDMGGTSRSRDVLAFGSPEGPNPGRWHNAVLTPKEQKHIDTKIDDGKPYTGKVIDISSTARTPNCTTNNTLSAKFNLARSSAECILIIDLN